MPEGVPHAVATLPVSAWPANEQALAFLLDAAEVLHQRAPDARIHVLGTAAGPAGPGLTYEGLVPELLPWLHHADACLLPYPPTAGACGGARNKLLEYLARGRAVVTTREGLRGLEEAGGWPGVVVAPDDAPGYATALAAALGNGHADAAAAREDLGRRLRWDVLAGEVETLLRSVA
jgi:glycosyltransferase involved in cell wall biosynthesis